MQTEQSLVHTDTTITRSHRHNSNSFTKTQRSFVHTNTTVTRHSEREFTSLGGWVFSPRPIFLDFLGFWW